MNKVYTRINWENYPSEKTAVNESNLNKMDYALNEIDKRVVEYDTTKANVASLNELIVDWHIDETTGIITIHKVSGEQIIFDLNLEKVPVGFSMTDDGILIMTTDDGTEFMANIGSMIPVFTFEDSAEIAFEVISKSQEKIEVENEVFFSAESAEGTVYASSSYTTYSHEPYKAFDNNGTTAWICDATYDANGQYLAYNFGQNVYPTSIDLTYRSQESNLSFIVQGCVEKEFYENNIWEDLTEEVSFEANASSQISLEITKDTPYKMYRLYLTGGDVNAYSYAIISELKIHGYKYANNAGEKIIKASIKTGSITEDKLQPNFLADCRLYAGNAENSALRAEEYAEQAEENAGKYQDITSVINQASKSWVFEESELAPMLCDAGEPDITRYPINKYADTLTRYLDVTTGKIYAANSIDWAWIYQETATSVKSELESVQSELATKRNYNYYTLHADDLNLTPGSERIFSIYNGRKFTDYSTYIFILIFNNSIQTTIEVVQGLFATTNHFTVLLSTVDSENVQYWAEVKWASDTSYKVNASSNLSGKDPKVFVYGCN